MVWIVCDPEIVRLVQEAREIKSQIIAMTPSDELVFDLASVYIEGDEEGE